MRPIVEFHELHLSCHVKRTGENVGRSDRAAVADVRDTDGGGDRSDAERAGGAVHSEKKPLERYEGNVARANGPRAQRDRVHAVLGRRPGALHRGWGVLPGPCRGRGRDAHRRPRDSHAFDGRRPGQRDSGRL